MPQNPNNTDPRKPKIVRINISWLYFLLLIVIGYVLFAQSGPAPQKIEWAQVQQMVQDGDVKEIHFVRNDFKGLIIPAFLLLYVHPFRTRGGVRRAQRATA